MKTLSIIGGRPNIIKVEPVHNGLIKAGITHELLDIGVFERPYGKRTYAELGLPNPITSLQHPNTNNYLSDIKILAGEIKDVLDQLKPDLLLVYGDLNPGIAASLSGMTKNVPIAHIEAGLRNRDLNDTEEINRLIIDRSSILLFCTSESSQLNLLSEGISRNKIFVVGNTIISSLKQHLNNSQNEILKGMGLLGKKFGLVTIHREENLMHPDRLDNILRAIEKIQQNTPLIFIQYRSTIQALIKNGYQNSELLKNIKATDTLSYHEYLGILKNASFVLTDSSGIQDEAAYLGIPCLTCRETTHRVDTVTSGNNVLVSDNQDKIKTETQLILQGKKIKSSYPNSWDENVGDLIADALLKYKELTHG